MQVAPAFGMARIYRRASVMSERLWAQGVDMQRVMHEIVHDQPHAVSLSLKRVSPVSARKASYCARRAL